MGSPDPANRPDGSARGRPGAGHDNAADAGSDRRRCGVLLNLWEWFAGDCTSRIAQHTMRGLPGKPTPARNSRKSEPSGRLSAAEWLALREQVEGEMQRRGIGMTELAAAIGRATATVTFLMVGRRPTLPTDHGLAACLPAPPEAGRDTRYTEECARQDGNAVHGLHSARNGHNGAATRSGAKPVPWRRG
jgi:hypothetical protein